MIAFEGSVLTAGRNGGLSLSEVVVKRYDGGWDVNVLIRGTGQPRARATAVLSPEGARELAAMLVRVADEGDQVGFEIRSVMDAEAS